MVERIWKILLDHETRDPDLYEDLWNEIQSMLKESYLNGYDHGFADVDRLNTDYDQGLTTRNDLC